MCLLNSLKNRMNFARLFLRLSFYSGHSAFGMYSMLFLSVSESPSFFSSVKRVFIKDAWMWLKTRGSTHVCRLKISLLRLNTLYKSRKVADCLIPNSVEGTVLYTERCQSSAWPLTFMQGHKDVSPVYWETVKYKFQYDSKCDWLIFVVVMFWSNLKKTNRPSLLFISS